MSIITIVEGKVPSDKSAELEYSFQAAKTQPLPPGLVTTSLLKNTNEPEVYRIQTVWENREVLEKMRQSTQTPRAIEIFQKAGANATLQVYEVVDTLP